MMGRPSSLTFKRLMHLVVALLAIRLLEWMKRLASNELFVTTHEDL
jgi:hypothetical protein